MVPVVNQPANVKSSAEQRMPDVERLARRTLQQNRVAIFIVAYNAEKHIESVLSRIPPWIAESLSEIFIIDDHSTDDTIGAVDKVDWPQHYAPLRIFHTPYNQGYGGNQRLGYLYAIDQGLDIVVLLHGDGQYAPEALPSILAPYADGAAAVFGSRFLTPGAARKGGMPFYKRVGNRILTNLQNSILSTGMSEMHSGYRSYRTSVLKQIPFTSNSLDFDFDADIIVQLHAVGYRIVEVPIPTYYGDEICRVNGMIYAWQCLKTTLRYRLMQLELCYDPKFDIRRGPGSHYTTKHAPTSLHHFIRSLPLPSGTRLIDVGGGRGAAVGRALAAAGVEVTILDTHADPADLLIKQFAVDLDQPWNRVLPAGNHYDVAIALDVLEHLSSPEQAATEIFQHLKSGGRLYASTGNVAFLPLRLALLFGRFNYGRRGILDLTHRRLFTSKSFHRLLRNAGFRVDRVIGFGPPLQDLERQPSSFLIVPDRILSWLARRWPSLFGYQILIECARPDSAADFTSQARKDLQADLLPTSDD
jgi:glycosyltransferase involved in cell wall biosynthesis